MNRNYINKKLIIVLIALFILVNFISASGLKNDLQLSEKMILSNSFDIIPGIPTKNGIWTVVIYHNGLWNGHTYQGAWTFEVSTNTNMTVEEKAQAMRDAINNKQGCPLSAGGTGSTVSVSAENGQIIKYSSKSDDGQSIHGKLPQMSAFCFIGTPSTGSVKIDIGGFIASTTTDGKSLIQIHNTLYNQLKSNGFVVFLDNSGLAIYVIGLYSSTGIDSDDLWLTSMGEFILDLSYSPFGIYVGMQEDIMGSSGNTVTAVFDFLNFRCESDTYKITATDELGWEIKPNYDEQGFTAGQKKLLEFKISIPTGSVNITNIVKVNIISLNSPWINCSGYIQIIVNNAPSTTIIDGTKNGIPQIEYQYNFTAIDPDADNIYYYIIWGDGNETGWIGPYPSGEKIIKNHSFYKQGVYSIKAAAKDINGLQGPYGTLNVIVPRTIAKNSILNLFLEKFLHIFKIFRYFLL